MLSVTSARRVTRPPGRSVSSASGRCRDPASLVEDLERIELEFVKLANNQQTDAEQSAFLEMAARVHRTCKDVGRLVRDVTG